jgi:inner membrane protein involved in colicin E2 resistance
MLIATGWTIGFTLGTIVVLAVVALVVPILMLAKSIGDRATDINASLEQSVENTAALSGLQTTIDSASAITAGLNRGRTRLGG